jgi:Flp pilus assembly protein TadG
MGRKLRSLIGRFGKSESGAVALLAGLAAIPMMLAAGVAIDFVHASSIKSRLQTSLDAAALAAASSRSLSEGERRKLANAIFARNWVDPMTADLKANPKFEFQGAGIIASADVEVPTAFLQLAGIKSMDVGSETNISIPVTKKAEVALVLDYSKSMTEVAGGRVKYEAMKDAAIKLVGELKAAGKDNAKIGLVPFTHQVYVTLPKAFVAGQTGLGSWSGCTQDRLYPYNISEASPTSNDKTKWNQSVLTVHGGCGSYVPRHLTVLPLTTEFDKVTDQLDQMIPYEYTHIALGVEFGWHLLSPNAPFTGVADYDDKSTQKYMVVLTDGRQTEPAFGPNGNRTAKIGEKNLETLCQRAKDDGIRMITIAFDLQDQETRDRLRDCSSDPDKDFFIADDDKDVAAAFSEITQQVAAQIYVSK